MQSILAELVRQERLVVVEDFSVDAPKTKDVGGKLTALELSNGLIVTETADENLFLSARNLKGVGVVEAGQVNPVDLIGFDKVLVPLAGKAHDVAAFVRTGIDIAANV